MEKNYFIGIGAQKAGTTWFANYFNMHEDVAFSPIKEVHYFDAKFIKKNKYWDKVFSNRLKKEIKGLKKNAKNIAQRRKRLMALYYRVNMNHSNTAYQEYFDWFGKKSSKISGEITPGYTLLNEEGFQDMKKQLDGDVRIFFLMRNPIERHWSNLKYLKDTRNFDPYKIFNTSFDDFQFIERGNYKRCLIELKKVFPDNEITIHFYEDIFKSNKTEEEVKKICKFLNISYLKPDIGVKVLPSAPMSLPIEMRSYGVLRLKEVYEYIFENFENVPESWHKDFSLL